LMVVGVVDALGEPPEDLIRRACGNSMDRRTRCGSRGSTRCDSGARGRRELRERRPGGQLERSERLDGDTVEKLSAVVGPAWPITWEMREPQHGPDQPVGRFVLPISWFCSTTIPAVSRRPPLGLRRFDRRQNERRPAARDQFVRAVVGLSRGLSKDSEDRRAASGRYGTPLTYGRSLIAVNRLSVALNQPVGHLVSNISRRQPRNTIA